MGIGDSGGWGGYPTDGTDIRRYIRRRKPITEKPLYDIGDRVIVKIHDFFDLKPNMIPKESIKITWTGKVSEVCEEVMYKGGIHRATKIFYRVKYDKEQHYGLVQRDCVFQSGLRTASIQRLDEI